MPKKIERTFLILKCEICNERATSLVRDLKAWDNPKTGLKEFETEDEIHRFCPKHNRESLVREMGTRVIPGEVDHNG
jgi:hypothetical protein